MVYMLSKKYKLIYSIIQQFKLHILFTSILLILNCSLLLAQKSPRFLKPFFKQGEVLQYAIKYGIFKCGEANLSVLSTDMDYNGKKAIHFTATGQTSGTFDIFYKVRNRYDSFIDPKTFLPYTYKENIRENSYKRSGAAEFDFEKKEVKSPKGLIPIKPDTRDIVSAFYFARSLDLSNVNQGDVIDIDYYLEGEVARLKITYEGKEEISTPMGTFSCFKFSPSVKAGRIFRKDSKMYLWITADANRVPIRAKAEILVGTIIMDLKGYSNLNTVLKGED